LYPLGGAKIELTSRLCSNCGKATSLAAEGEEEKRGAEQEAVTLPKGFDDKKENKEKKEEGKAATA
jgi:hypothetical protein